MMKRIASALGVCAFFTIVGIASAAQCKVNGEWFDYDSAECRGLSGSPTDSDHAASAASSPDDRDLAVDNMKRRDLVRDAAANLSEENVILVLIMNAAANERYAKGVGEDFVRQYIAFSDEETGDPGELIGETRFDYNIKIADNYGNTMHHGAKVSFAKRITW